MRYKKLFVLFFIIALGFQARKAAAFELFAQEVLDQINVSKLNIPQNGFNHLSFHQEMGEAIRRALKKPTAVESLFENALPNGDFTKNLVKKLDEKGLFMIRKSYIKAMNQVVHSHILESRLIANLSMTRHKGSINRIQDYLKTYKNLYKKGLSYFDFVEGRTLKSTAIYFDIFLQRNLKSKTKLWGFSNFRNIKVIRKVALKTLL